MTQHSARPDLCADVPEQGFAIEPYARFFVYVLDEHARALGKDHWIEKTPFHIYETDLITRFVPGARFVHIVRSGEAVVASLYDASQTRRERTWNRWSNLDRCINAWNSCLRETKRLSASPDHHAVRYESLVADPKTTLEETCGFLDLRFDPAMIERRGELKRTPGPHSGRSAMYREKVLTDTSRFKTVFSAAQQAYVLERLESAEELE